MKKILVIEDNHAIMDVITLILQSEAYKVEGLNRGMEMMQYIKEFNPDMLIMDIMLPDGDGRDLLTTIRETAETLHVPVLMISAKYTAETFQQGKHKPNGFLAKPFDIDELLDKIEGILAGKNYID